MNITTKSVIREEVWRARENELTVDLALLVHVGNKVVLPYDTVTAILARAKFEMVESQSRRPQVGDNA